MASQSRFLRAIGAERLVPHSKTLRTTGRGIFQPTATTSFLLKEAKKRIKPGMKILDLGCGWGIIGLELALELQGDGDIYLSDKSKEAADAARENTLSLGLNCLVAHGSLLEPWVGKVFDLIVCDVSGISNQIPILDIWFDGVPCETGTNGLALMQVIIENAKLHLRDSNSAILIPLISLSDTTSALRLMEDNFSRVNLISENMWSIEIPKVADQIQMESLRKQNVVSFTSIGNIFQFTTLIYELRS